MSEILLKVPNVRPGSLAKLAAFLESTQNRVSERDKSPMATLVVAKRYSGNDNRYGLTLKVEFWCDSEIGEYVSIPAAQLQQIWDALGLYPNQGTVTSAPAQIGDGTLNVAVEAAEKAAIRAALEQTGGHKDEAAAFLGISRKILWEKCKVYEIDFGIE